MSRARDFADLAGSADAGGLTGRNLIINGAMQVAQRGTSSTLTQIRTCDRWKVQFSGDVTQSQEDLSSSDTPYSFGFRKALKLLNTANADATNTYTQVFQIIEAQNVASSGWDYTSSSSSITVQFWVKSSLAGTYTSFLRTNDGTSRSYSFDFVLVADTWKLVTVTVPGNSGLTFGNDTGAGLDLFVVPYYGSNFTTPSHTDDAWQTYAGGDIAGDYAQNWKNTSSATFFITGVQLEIGDKATPFEHRSYADELARCQRYYYRRSAGGVNDGFLQGGSEGQSTFAGIFTFPVSMRALPAYSSANGTNYFFVFSGSAVNFDTLAGFVIQSPDSCILYQNTFGTSLTANAPYTCRFQNTSAFIQFDAEL